MKTTRQILVEARELIADPARWTQGAYSRLADGAPCAVADSPNATCWCADGAVRRVCSLSGVEPFAALASLGLQTRYFHAGGGIWRINDRGTHADVLAMFDRAIAACPDGP